MSTFLPRPLVMASLFTGQGGFDLAGEWMGWHTALMCENNPFLHPLLRYYWPGAVLHPDVKDLSPDVYQKAFAEKHGTAAPAIDLLCGGFPCQPYSSAGKRLGTEDERHLWPYMLGCIVAFRPTWVVGENVPGLATWNGGAVFEDVCSDLEAAGYDVLPVTLSAAGEGAPHLRHRIIFVARRRDAAPLYAANPLCDRCRHGADQSQPEQKCQRTANIGETGGKAAHTDGDRWAGGFSQIEEKRWEQGLLQTGELAWRSERFCRHGDAAHTDQQRTYGGRIAGPCENRSGMESANCDCLSDANVAHPACQCKKQRKQAVEGLRSLLAFGGNEGDRDQANNRWQAFPTVSPICAGDDGISAQLDIEAVFEGIERKRRIMKPQNAYGRWRRESIKAGGNAVVPHVIHRVFKAIDAYEKEIAESACH